MKQPVTYYWWRYGIFVSVCLTLISVVPSIAQTDTAKTSPSVERPGSQPSKDEPELEMPDMSEMWKGMTEMYDSQYELMAKPETAERMATFYKNFYDALLRKGFSKDDALKILLKSHDNCGTMYGGESAR